MSAQEIPEWFIEYLEDNTGFYCIDSNEEIYIRQTERSEAVIDFYNFISKPENAAKIPEVAKLIEACEPEGKNIPNTILGEGFTVFSLNKERIEEALKSFKKEGES